MGLTDSALWQVGMSQFANRCKSSHDSRQNAHNVFMSEVRMASQFLSTARDRWAWQRSGHTMRTHTHTHKLLHCTHGVIQCHKVTASHDS